MRSNPKPMANSPTAMEAVFITMGIQTSRSPAQGSSTAFMTAFTIMIDGSTRKWKIAGAMDAMAEIRFPSHGHSERANDSLL